MKKPIKEEFIEERKIDGKMYKSVNEQMYRFALEHYEDYKKDKYKHSKVV